MKNYKFISSIFIVAMMISASFITGCNSDDPEDILEVVADFTFTNESNSLEVVFTNASENATSYSWDFGDDNSSTDANPTHTYDASGTYSVKLTATNEAGDSKTVTKEISVSQTLPLTVGFTVSNEANSLVVAFTNTSENAVSYSWDFGDGSDAVTDENPTHTYAEAGTYTVSLTAEGEDGSTESSSQDITLTESVEVEPGDLFDSFSGEAGESNVEWTVETAITLDFGVEMGDEKVGKYTRSGTDGSQYDKIYIRPLPEDVIWTERTVFSIDVYFPSTNSYAEDRSQGITKNVELRLRKDKEDGSGSDSGTEIRLIKDVTALDEWVTIEFDMSEAAHFSGDPTFDPNAPYTTIVMMLGRDGGLFEGEFYLKNFKRL